MSFEEGYDMTLILILLLATITVIGGFLLYLHQGPGIEGGLLVKVVDAIKFLLEPTV